MLPSDEVGHGFDNIAGNLTVSPALLERYMAAARRISRLAVGDPTIGPGYTSRVYSVPMNMTQNDRMSEDLPLGSRGGLAASHNFPLDGEYHLRIRLKKSVYEYIVNLEESHELDVRLDGVRIARYPIGGLVRGKPAPVSFSGTFMAAGGTGFPTQEWDDYRTSADAHLNLTVNAKAGTHTISVAFIGKSWENEGILQPRLREYGATVTEITDTTSRPEGPGVESLTVDGPYNPMGSGQTPSRQRIFTCRPSKAEEDTACARRIISTLARRAFRRPVTDRDVTPLMAFYESGRAARGFEGGVEAAIERMLVDPEFIFRIESGTDQGSQRGAHRCRTSPSPRGCRSFSGAASRTTSCSTLAERGRLKDPAVLEQQIAPHAGRSHARMPSSRTSSGSGCSFARSRGRRRIRTSSRSSTRTSGRRSSWKPSSSSRARCAKTVQLMELLSADYTFLNERLAQHYEIPNVSREPVPPGDA